MHDRHGIAFELGTLSKILAPGLRIGYMIGPDTSFLRAMVQRINDMGFSAPVMNQEIASYLLDHHAAEQVRTVNAGYREKAKRTREWIARYLEPHLEECTGGSAGFYYYLTFKNCLTEEGSPFFNYLARTTGIQEHRRRRPAQESASRLHPRGFLRSSQRRFGGKGQTSIANIVRL